MAGYPRVLIVSKSLINDRDNTGVLRNWFKEWPRECLAQLYSGDAIDTGAFCSFNFKLGPHERRFGGVFYRLKGSALGDAAQPIRQSARSPLEGSEWRQWRKLVYDFGDLLIQSGLWELIFLPRLSPRLKEWVKTFRPDVMFVQGADVSFMRLPLLIHDEFGIPICFNMVDDWVEDLYGKSPVAPLMQNVVRDTFCQLIENSTLRFTIGELMAEEYQRRYGIPFSPLMQCDDSERFSIHAKEDRAGAGPVRIVYSGTLALERWQALVELATVAEILRHDGFTITITAYAPFIPMEAGDKLRKLPALSLCGALPDCDVPRVLSTADILFLPESFEPMIRSYIKLSVSTKAHLYMMSGRPILVYGPTEIGTVDYARREKWGYVVDRQGLEPLANALRKMLADRDLCDALVKKGFEVAARNHDGKTVRKRLHSALSEFSST
jgi:glycosyltransferase involved in cell wall biosynthesis